MFVQWHLGHFTQAHTPGGRGFDYFFGFLFGSETHDSHNSYGRHTCNVPITDLYNTTTRANTSVHYKNMTYSPEMYAVSMARPCACATGHLSRAANLQAEMERLIVSHPIHSSDKFFLYMAFQNNHAPVSAELQSHGKCARAKMPERVSHCSTRRSSSTLPATPSCWPAR